MTSESWFAIDSDDSPLRNRKITTVVLGPVDKPEPALDAGEQDEANEAAGCLVIACGDPALFFEVAETALDAGTQGIEPHAPSLRG